MKKHAEINLRTASFVTDAAIMAVSEQALLSKSFSMEHALALS